ncbi:MAG: ATP-dependent DNA helicase [Desulfobacteraceae bacterium]|nr:ATP-dependent DNA helicase [Desulfobacteraceae bacterium]
MSKKETFRISVKNLISICLRQGDLSRGYVSRSRALEGIREHTRIQSLRPDHYKKEVPVSFLKKQKQFNLEIFGRIDGIFESDDTLTVEEIKTCQNDPNQMADDPAPIHMAQLKCYGYMILKERNLTNINLQLTYVQVKSEKTAENKKLYSADELTLFFNDLISRYISILQNQTNWMLIRNKSIESLPFPYGDFRQGQRHLAETVYKIIKNKKILFAKAPTGTGKTIATLFPAIKSLGLKHIDKIFYLTSKTVGRTVATKALNDMADKGLRLKSIILTAKQKICFESDESCDMESCSYAKDYYTKLKGALSEVYKYDAFDQNLLETLGKKYHLCPFELSLDISLICDVIICDLNYCFDPRVYLKRYFDHSNPNCTFLIDEAHNLPDRLKSMYSAQLIKTDVLKTQRLVRELLPGISKSLVKINRHMLKMKKQCIAEHASFLEFDQIPEDFMAEIKEFAVKTDIWLDQNKDSDIRPDLLDFYFNVSIFLIIAGYFDSNYKFYIERINENDLNVRLFCMDPSPIFSSLIKRSHSSIMFSATLFPIDYYKDILFEDTVDPFSIMLPSCFPKENFGLFVYSPIKTTFKERHNYYNDIANTIQDVINSKQGNYIVYFPSYAYMNTVVDILVEQKDLPQILVQTPNMTESERQEFLNTFTDKNNMIGFAVMGGIFGEGIDLTGNLLIGAIIVSVGIPQICPERDLIKAYYDTIDNSGFYKSYQMPGFNRVMQAAGRVVRSETDKGIVILIDNRFTRQDYRSLFPDEWQEYSIIHTAQSLKNKLHTFWNLHIE